MGKVCLTVFFAGLLGATNTETFTGVITDTMCGAHHGMMKSTPDAQCFKMCVNGQYAYSLFDGTNVMKLSDQKTPAKYSAQKVRVTGAYNAKTKTIKVVSIEPVESR